MPFTFFAHQLPVIPLKWALPRWFDGTALCVGSMAPDLAYAFIGSPLAFASHTLRAQLFWSVPVTLALTHLFRTRLAEPIGAQLPGALGLELRALAHSRRAWFVTCLSALLGGLSHRFLDGFTHYDGWAVRRSSALRAVLFELAGHKVHVFGLLQYLGHSFGTLLGLLLVVELVRRRQFSRWNGLELRPFAASSAAASTFWRAGAV